MAAYNKDIESHKDHRHIENINDIQGFLLGERLNYVSHVSYAFQRAIAESRAITQECYPRTKQQSVDRS